jgi:hypothetical protein
MFLIFFLPIGRSSHLWPGINCLESRTDCQIPSDSLKEPQARSQTQIPNYLFSHCCFCSNRHACHGYSSKRASGASSPSSSCSVVGGISAMTACVLLRGFSTCSLVRIHTYLVHTYPFDCPEAPPRSDFSDPLDYDPTNYLPADSSRLRLVSCHWRSMLSLVALNSPRLSTSSFILPTMSRPSNRNSASREGQPRRNKHTDSPTVALSKQLSWLLRHGLDKSGLEVRMDGYVNLDELVSLPLFNLSILTTVNTSQVSSVFHV